MYDVSTYYLLQGLILGIFYYLFINWYFKKRLTYLGILFAIFYAIINFVVFFAFLSFGNYSGILLEIVLIILLVHFWFQFGRIKALFTGLYMVSLKGISLMTAVNVLNIAQIDYFKGFHSPVTFLISVIVALSIAGLSIPCSLINRTVLQFNGKRLRNFSISAFLLFASICLILFEGTKFISLKARWDYGNSIIYIALMLLMTALLSLVITTGLTSLKASLAEGKLEQQRFSQEKLEDAVYELGRYKHNFDNILASLKGLVKAGKLEEADKYLNSYSAVKSGLGHYNTLMLTKVKIHALGGLLSSKAERAKEMGVSMKITIREEANETSIDLNEMCEIIGILLDNAIEASAESVDKTVRVDIYNENGIQVFSIENSFLVKPELTRIFDKNFSTKGESRGLGLWILKKILSKYRNCSLNTFLSEKTIKQELVIELNDGGML